MFGNYVFCSAAAVHPLGVDKLVLALLSTKIKHDGAEVNTAIINYFSVIDIDNTFNYDLIYRKELPFPFGA